LRHRKKDLLNDNKRDEEKDRQIDGKSKHRKIYRATRKEGQTQRKKMR
jgi:hypothetical protein